jgi:hypothetical protein
MSGVCDVSLEFAYPWRGNDTLSSQSFMCGDFALNELYTVMVSPVFVLFCVFGEASKLTHKAADFGQ